MTVYGQGTLATFDVYIYDFNGPNKSLVDPDGYITSTEPTITIKDPDGVEIESGNLATRISQGYYQYQYQIPDSADVGTWSIVWVFTVNGNVPAESNRTEYFRVTNAGYVLFDVNTLINNLRLRLKDNHPNTQRRKWTDEELYTFLDNSLIAMNGEPPGISNFYLDQDPLWYEFVPQWKDVILEGAIIMSLIAQGIFEISKEFSFSDNGISLSIDRGSKYQSMASMLLASWERRKTTYKKSYWMKALKPGVILTSELMARFSSLSPSSFRLR